MYWTLFMVKMVEGTMHIVFERIVDLKNMMYELQRIMERQIGFIYFLFKIPNTVIRNKMQAEQ